MTASYLYLIPVSLVLGGAGLAAFFWCLRNRQYDDLQGAAERILMNDPNEQDAGSNDA